MRMLPPESVALLPECAAARHVHALAAHFTRCHALAGGMDQGLWYGRENLTWAVRTEEQQHQAEEGKKLRLVGQSAVS